LPGLQRQQRLCAVERLEQRKLLGHHLVGRPLRTGQYHSRSPGQPRLAPRTMSRRSQSGLFLVRKGQRLFGASGSHLSLDQWGICEPAIGRDHPDMCSTGSSHGWVLP
jgi:hypothetical protein